MVKQWQLMILAAVLGGAGTGCAPIPPQPAPLPESGVRGDDASGDPGCDDWGCGSNTPKVNDHPLRGLHLDGEKNHDGVHLRARGSHALVYIHGQPLWLDVVRGEFVATDKTGRVVKRGTHMKGSWFFLHLPGKEPVRVTIQEVSKVRLFPAVRRGVASGKAGDDVWAYELTYDQPVNPDKPYLCPEAWVWGGEPHSGPDGWTDSDGAHRPYLRWTEQGRFAVLVKGELYDARTATVVHAVRDPERWFNIACSGMALSKMRLMGYDPEDRQYATTWQQRQATLKMITARYCPERPDMSFTKMGQPLIWQNAGLWFRPDAQEVGKVEAVWNEDGAKCLDVPRWRTWTRDEVEGECETRFPRCGRLSPLVPRTRLASCRAGRCLPPRWSIAGYRGWPGPKGEWLSVGRASPTIPGKPPIP